MTAEDIKKIILRTMKDNNIPIGIGDISVYKDIATITIAGKEITFDLLYSLSCVLVTKKIDIDAGSWIKGCDTCGCGDERQIDINIREIGIVG